MTIFYWESDVRNTARFNEFLDLLRTSNNERRDDDPLYLYTLTNTDKYVIGQRGRYVFNDDDEVYCTRISDLIFYSKQLTDDDIAAGALGDALQVQLQNVLGLDENYDADDVSVDVVNHLQIVVEHLSTDIEKYQSLLQYIANYRNNPYLESISIHKYGRFPPPFDEKSISQEITSAFLSALLPPITTIAGTTMTMQQTTSGIGLQKLAICDCANMNTVSFATFINQMSIPILEIDSVNFTQTDDEYGSNNDSNFDLITDAFRNNTTIQELYFVIDHNTSQFITMVLKKLMYNTTLCKLRLQWFLGGADATVQVREFMLALVQYLTETKTLQHIELRWFEFLDADNSKSLLTSISNNRSIQGLTLYKCSFDDEIWKHVFATHFQHFVHLRRFELDHDLKMTREEIFERMTNLIHEILPSNIFIQDLYIAHEERLRREIVGHTIVHESFLLCYLRRNRGIQQFIQQYVKRDNTSSPISMTLQESTEKSQTTPSIFDIGNYNKDNHSFNIHDSLYMIMQKQRRKDHQYHSIQRKRNSTEKGTTTDTSDSCDTTSGGPKSNKNSNKIQIELVPTILSNHFVSASTNYHYGRTIVYQMFSSMNFNHYQLE